MKRAVMEALVLGSHGEHGDWNVVVNRADACICLASRHPSHVCKRFPLLLLVGWLQSPRATHALQSP